MLNSSQESERLTAKLLETPSEAEMANTECAKRGRVPVRASPVHPRHQAVLAAGSSTAQSSRASSDSSGLYMKPMNRAQQRLEVEERQMPTPEVSSALTPRHANTPAREELLRLQHGAREAMQIPQQGLEYSSDDPSPGLEIAIPKPRRNIGSVIADLYQPVIGENLQPGQSSRRVSKVILSPGIADLPPLTTARAAAILAPPPGRRVSMLEASTDFNRIHLDHPSDMMPPPPRSDSARRRRGLRRGRRAGASSDKGKQRAIESDDQVQILPGPLASRCPSLHLPQGSMTSRFANDEEPSAADSFMLRRDLGGHQCQACRCVVERVDLHVPDCTRSGMCADWGSGIPAAGLHRASQGSIVAATQMIDPHRGSTLEEIVGIRDAMMAAQRQAQGIRLSSHGFLYPYGQEGQQLLGVQPHVIDFQDRELWRGELSWDRINRQ